MNDFESKEFKNELYQFIVDGIKSLDNPRNSYNCEKIDSYYENKIDGIEVRSRKFLNTGKIKKTEFENLLTEIRHLRSILEIATNQRERTNLVVIVGVMFFIIFLSLIVVISFFGF